MSHIRPVTARPAPPMINIQSTSRTLPGVCKNVLLAVLCGSNGNSYTAPTHSYVCVCVCVCLSVHTLHHIETLIVQK
jgi:hypothetical protein